MYRVHPRRVQYDRFWTRIQSGLERRQPGVISHRTVRPDDPGFQDWWPDVPGTVAEKMVFAELARLGVSFFFGPYWGDMPWTDRIYERYRPDFILPEYRIVIEVYGTYWHTRPGDTERDAHKAVAYEAAGYRYVNLWEWEIYMGVREAIQAKIPELVNPAIVTGKIFVSERPFDPTASLVWQRQSEPKVIRQRIRWAGSRPRAASAVHTERPKLMHPKAERPERESGFQGLTEKHLRELRAYADQWKRYVEGLGRFFNPQHGAKQKYYNVWYQGKFWSILWVGPSADELREDRREEYRNLFRYYLRWKEWWNKWQLALEASPAWWDYVEQLGRYFETYPDARWQYREEYYRWLRWRRSGYREL